MLSPVVLTVRYTLFAAIATIINIGTQYISNLLYTGAFELPVAMVLGTGTGLVAKYVLDKRWIFYDRTSSLRGHSVKFTLYTAMGVVTTVIFWATELLFEALGDGPYLRYVGAVIGLAIGYFTKYSLDRRFVFQVKPT